MTNNKNKTTMIVFGVFALVIVTTAASFAFFTYSRVGNTTTTITSGDIEFSFIEGTSAELSNAFPVSDSVGAKDTSKEYKFDVKMKSSSASNKMNYNVYLLDANNDENTNYFTNDQIKFALVKDGVFVAGTSETTGVKLSELAGFDEGATTGEGIVLEDQEITSGVTNEYKLRIWISDDVNYSNTDNVDDGTDVNNDTQTSTGKYNGYKYSLKVKVTSGIQTTIVFENIKVSDKTMTAEISDPNGLDAYAVTTSSTAPEASSSEWIEITNDTAKSNVKRTASDKITSKTITYTVENDGVYYLHVRNDIKQLSKKKIVIEPGSEQIISFDANGGNKVTTTKVISSNGLYGELPIPTRTGYAFTGWYTSSSGGQVVTESSVYSNIMANKLYAGWEPNKYIVSFDANGGSVSQATKEVFFDSLYGSLPIPTRDGWNFEGWYTEIEDGEKITDATKVSTTSSLTLYAKWKLAYGNGASYIMNLASINVDELRVDNHEATGQQNFVTTEYRYWGANPNNYVSFNGELWRIIGAMDVDNGSGKIEKRLKIIRKDSIGSYSWDSSDSTVNNGYGVNEWSQSDLMILLNSGAYYNRTKGTCYNAPKNVTTSCDFSLTGLTTAAKEMISDAKWYLGAHTTNDVLRKDIYESERGTLIGKQCTAGTSCTDSVERTTSWVGKIGLMYPSDYGYATDIEECSNISLSHPGDGDYKICYDMTWLKYKTSYQWAITPSAKDASERQAYTVFGISHYGWINNQSGASNAYAVFPVTYLRSDIKIIDGIGTDTQPFVLSK